MSVTRSLVLTLAVGALFAGVGSAQSKLWVVDKSGGTGADFDRIQLAIDIASDGDVVLVRAGDYADFEIDGRSLSVVADAGALVRITKSAKVPGQYEVPVAVVVTNLSANQSVLLRGIDIVPDHNLNLSAALPSPAALQLSVNTGPVWIEDCEVQGNAENVPFFFQSGVGTGVRAFSCASVTLVNCLLEGPPDGGAGFSHTQNDEGHGLEVQLTDAFLFGCDARGGSTPGPYGLDSTTCFAATPPRQGMRVISGFVHASGCSFLGGDGGDGFTGGIGSLGYTVGASGGHGLELAFAGAELDLLQTTSAGGSAGLAGAPGCADGVPGLPLYDPFAGVTQLPGAARGLSVDSPLRELQLGSIAYWGAPGDLVFVLLANNAPPVYLPPTGALYATAPLTLFQVGSADAAGALTVAIVAPALPPGFDVLEVALQPLALGTSGELRLGGPSFLTVIDQGF